MTIGEKVYELRSERDMSLREFAEATGLTHTTIARIESPTLGPQKIFLDTVYQICKKLHYSFEEFLVDTDYLPKRAERRNEFTHSAEEIELVEKYRGLNPACKKLINNTIDTLVTTSTVAPEQKRKG